MDDKIQAFHRNRRLSVDSPQPGLAQPEAAEPETDTKTVRARRQGRSSSICPVCGEHSLVQTTRRNIDRFYGLFVSLRRYRCNNMECGWQGNLVKSRLFRRRPGQFQNDTSHWPMLLTASLLVLIIVLLLVALLIGWIDGSLEGAEGLFYRQTDSIE
jgi:hypothetical protein